VIEAQPQPVASAYGYDNEVDDPLQPVGCHIACCMSCSARNAFSSLWALVFASGLSCLLPPQLDLYPTIHQQPRCFAHVTFVMLCASPRRRSLNRLPQTSAARASLPTTYSSPEVFQTRFIQPLGSFSSCLSRASSGASQPGGLSGAWQHSSLPPIPSAERGPVPTLHRAISLTARSNEQAFTF
jgi:hypothetical protein